MCNLEDVREDTRGTWQHVNTEVRKFKPRETFMQFSERLGGSNRDSSPNGANGHQTPPVHGGHTEGNIQRGGEDDIRSKGMAAAPLMDENAPLAYQSS